MFMFKDSYFTPEDKPYKDDFMYLLKQDVKKMTMFAAGQSEGDRLRHGARDLLPRKHVQQVQQPPSRVHPEGNQGENALRV